MRGFIDNDLYKYTMQNAVCKLFPNAEAEYTFINRGGTKFPPGFAQILKNHLEEFRGYVLSPSEKQFMVKECPYFSPVYLDFLEGYRYNPDEVIVEDNDGDFSLKVIGPWYRTILWEVPLMALISELYFGKGGLFPDVAIMPEIDENHDINKANKFKALGIKFIEFGTRRRHSLSNQDRIVEVMKAHAGDSFMGTSNLMLGMKHGLKVYGTQAHEWFMAMGAMYGFKLANEMSLKHWKDVYGSELAVALTDTYTTDNFFNFANNFPLYASQFDGVRHDSGDALVFADKVISFYEKMSIDPLAKIIIFSDGLDYDEAKRIHNYCKGRIQYSFGIGTNLTNDIYGIKALNMVIKLTKFRLDDDSPWKGVVKLSDVEGKHTGAPHDIELCKGMINSQEEKTI